mmetsp:Transcript_26904/g.75625  ORF Transcript_26904/g.75625 Transcript_26904/m.75625 type:complete len:185 (+) Transcript_26904:72-626(+)
MTRMKTSLLSKCVTSTNGSSETQTTPCCFAPTTWWTQFLSWCMPQSYCPVCLCDGVDDEGNKLKWFKAKRCGHRICRNCHHGHLSNQLESKTAIHTPVCAVCLSKLSRKDVRAGIAGNKKLRKLWKVRKENLRQHAEDKKSMDWTATNAKRCPACRVPIEKNGGCNLMICTQCEHHFSWKATEH